MYKNGNGGKKASIDDRYAAAEQKASIDDRYAAAEQQAYSNQEQHPHHGYPYYPMMHQWQQFGGTPPYQIPTEQFGMHAVPMHYPMMHQWPQFGGVPNSYAPPPTYMYAYQATKGPQPCIPLPHPTVFSMQRCWVPPTHQATNMEPQPYSAEPIECKLDGECGTSTKNNKDIILHAPWQIKPGYTPVCVIAANGKPIYISVAPGHEFHDENCHLANWTDQIQTVVWSNDHLTLEPMCDVFNFATFSGDSTNWGGNEYE
jgi:hypothetical protein